MINHKDAEALLTLCRDELNNKPELRINEDDAYDTSFLWNATHYLMGTRPGWARVKSKNSFFDWRDLDRLRVICDITEQLCPDTLRAERLAELRGIRYRPDRQRFHDEMSTMVI